MGGAIITALGIGAIRNNREPGKNLFAAIPMLFGVQQIAEGFVWQSLQAAGHDTLLKVATYIFLTIALVVWPTMMPLSVLLMEKPGKKRGPLYVFLAIGIFMSVGYFIAMLVYQVTPQIIDYHIQYVFDCPQWLAQTALIFYVFATLPPLFVASNKKVNLFGGFMLLAYFLTYYFFRAALVSVWCFFAALISIIIWWIVSSQCGESVEQSS